MNRNNWTDISYHTMASSSSLDFQSIVIELESYYVSLKHEACLSQRSNIVCINTDLDNKLQQIQDCDPRHRNDVSLSHNLIVRHNIDEGMTRVTDNDYEDYSRCGIMLPTVNDNMSPGDGCGDTVDSNWSGFVPKPFVGITRRDSEPVEDPEYDLANYYESITEQCIANLSHEMHKSPMKVQKRGHVLVVTCPDSPPPLPPKMMKPPPLPPKQKDRRFSDSSCIVNQCSVHKKTKMTLHHSRTSLEGTTTKGTPRMKSKFRRSSTSLTTTTMTTTKQEGCEELYLTAQETVEGLSSHHRMDSPILVSKTKRIRASSFQSIQHDQQQENLSSSETLIRDSIQMDNSPLLPLKKRICGSSVPQRSARQHQNENLLQQQSTQQQHGSIGQKELYLTARDCETTTTKIYEHLSSHPMETGGNRNGINKKILDAIDGTSATTTFDDVGAIKSSQSSLKNIIMDERDNNIESRAENKVITSQHEQLDANSSRTIKDDSVDCGGVGTVKSIVNDVNYDNTTSRRTEKDLLSVTSQNGGQTLVPEVNPSTMLRDVNGTESDISTKTITCHEDKTSRIYTEVDIPGSDMSNKALTSHEEKNSTSSGIYTEVDTVQGLLKDLNSVHLLRTTDNANGAKNIRNNKEQQRSGWEFAMSPNGTMQRTTTKKNHHKDSRTIEKENKEKAERERSLQRRRNLVTSFCDVRGDTKIWSVEQLMNTTADAAVAADASIEVVAAPSTPSTSSSVRTHQTEHMQYDTADTTSSTTTAILHQQSTMKKYQTIDKLSKKGGGRSLSTTSVEMQIYKHRTEIRQQKKANRTDKKKRRSLKPTENGGEEDETERQRKLVNRRSSNLTPLTRLRLYEVKRRQQRLSLVMRSTPEDRGRNSEGWMDNNFLRCYKDAENNWKNTPLFHPFWYECMCLAQRRREKQHKTGFHDFSKGFGGLEYHSPRRSLQFGPMRSETSSSTIRSLSYYNETDDIISIYKYFW